MEENSLQCLEIAPVMSFSCHFLMRNPELWGPDWGKRSGKRWEIILLYSYSALLRWVTGVSHGKRFNCKDHGIFSPSLGLVPGFLNLVSVLLRGGIGISKFYQFSESYEMSVKGSPRQYCAYCQTGSFLFCSSTLPLQITHTTSFALIWTELLGFLLKEIWVWKGRSNMR